MNCAVCDTPLYPGNQSGRCRLHPSPETNAKRGVAIKRRYDTDPDFRARQKAGAGRQTEAGRKAISDAVRASRLWEKGRAHFTPETYAKRGASIRARALSHIPTEYRDLYTELRKKRRMPVADALAAVEQQQAADAARYRREMCG